MCWKILERSRENVTLADRTIDLDKHRGLAAQKATETRRLLADVEADAQAVKSRQAAMESNLSAKPARTWKDAAKKARYLLLLLASTPAVQDPRRKQLIANVLDDFCRLGLRD